MGMSTMLMVVGLMNHRFLQGRSDFVHRPATPLAPLYFQNDFFLIVARVIDVTVTVTVTVVIAVDIVSSLIVGSITSSRIDRRSRLYSPPPELNHKGYSMGVAQDPSVRTVIDGTDIMDPQNGPQAFPNLGNLESANDQRRG